MSSPSPCPNIILSSPLPTLVLPHPAPPLSYPRPCPGKMLTEREALMRVDAYKLRYFARPQVGKVDYYAPLGHVISTHPINTRSQHTHSTRPLNTRSQHTLLTHLLNTPSQDTLPFLFLSHYPHPAILISSPIPTIPIFPLSLLSHCPYRPTGWSQRRFWLD